ncbi:MAG: hypothetical protein JWM00_240 [Candidatus Saccharibacteria bacterium]|nr:hypothetical protein [Candidatus Saccharibacteria bacterium]
MTTTHNHAPQVPAELTAAERAVFTVDKLNEWRTAQRAILHDTKFGNGPNSFNLDWQADFDALINDSLDRFLEKGGIANDTVNFAEVRQLFRDASIDNISEDEWGNSPASRGLDPNNHQSQSDMFKERIEQRAGTQPIASAELTPGQIAEFELLETGVEAARELWATESAKRQDKFFSAKNKKRDELRDDYFKKVQELGKLHLASHEDYSDEDKNLLAMTVLFDEQEKLRVLTKEKLEGTSIGKFVNWMNKGSTITRIAKGVSIGVVAGTAGSFLAGAIGAGVITVGAIGASRFARNFAIKDHQKRGMASIYDAQNSIDFDANELHTSAALGFTTDDDRMSKIEQITGANEAFEGDTRKEQGKRRKSAAYGTIMMGAGALVGYGIHEGIERAQDSNLTATGWVKDQWNDFWHTDGERPEAPGNKPHIIDRDHDGIRDGKDPFVDANHDGFDDRTGEAPLDMHDIPHDARWVEPGEGWYQTFNELGIPQDNWQDVLRDAGPKLHEQGWAYRMPDGQWGISQPGRLPDSALKIIAESSKDNGYSLAA